MPVNERQSSFPASLFKKKSDTICSGQESGADVSAALAECDRQIQQVLRGGDIVKGKGVTKSGDED